MVQTEEASAISPPPDIIVIQVDDLDLGSLLMAAHPPSPTPSPMPHFVNFIESKGTTFSNSFVTNSLCCPSRATFLTGQYAHNHGVLRNQPTANDPDGGGCGPFEPLEGSALPTWLQNEDIPYFSGIVGKYLNVYGCEHDGSCGPNAPDPHPDCMAEDYVAPGWDEWHVLLGNAQKMHSYAILDSGHAGTSIAKPAAYQTDALKTRATTFIQNAPTNQPYFLYVAPTAPHLEVGRSQLSCTDNTGEQPRTIEAPPPYDDDAENIPLPQLANFNEEDVDDKPSYFNDIHRYTSAAQINCTQTQYRDRLESLKAVDNMIGAIALEVAERPDPENTVVIFTSDNGYFLGEHRLHGKQLAYEESIRVPLVVRFVDATSQDVQTVDAFVVNTDLAPTIADLAEATPTLDVDGRSWVDWLPGGPTPTTWRKRFLVEHYSSGEAGAYPTLFGVRTGDGDELYVEYDTDEQEYYEDLDQDHSGQVPDRYEMDNGIGTCGATCDDLADILALLETCGGTSTDACHYWEDQS